MSDENSKNRSVPDMPERLILVGTICALWAHLESVLAITIWLILDLDDETGKIVTGGLDILPRVNMAINLAQHRRADRTLIAALRKTRSDIQKIIAERNLIIHGALSIDRLTRSVVGEVHRGKGSHSPQPISLPRIKKLRDDIDSIIDHLQPKLQILGVSRG